MSHHEAKQSTAATGKALVVKREFEAPREKVWKAWSTPDQLKAWWAAPFTVPLFETDFRVGGKYFYNMRSPEGQDVWGTGVYKEIVPMQRIVATDSFADAKGNVVSPTTYGMGADVPNELLLTVTFEDIGGKTRLTLRHEGLRGEDKEMTRQGWEQSLDKLAGLLK